MTKPRLGFIRQPFLGHTLSTQTTPPPVYITTPIFYANAEPHIGHLYSTVLADTLGRYYALKGNRTLLSTGTDEHGQKIQEAAAKHGIPTGAFCDEVSNKFKNLFDEAGVDYTDFVRTTEPRHRKAVEHLWQVLVERGYIYKGHHEGWYAVSDETFYPASQVEPVLVDGETRMVGAIWPPISLTTTANVVLQVSKETGVKVIWMKEENYKFRLSLLKQPLLDWLQKNPTAIIPKFRQDEIVDALTLRADEQLADLSVSRLRKRVSWGIPVPNDPDHVIYVWLDALANYLTVLGYPWETPSATSLQDAWPAQWHVVGKDILKFHAIYWPAFLIAAGLAPPRKIVAHGHWLMGNSKMSKSKGNVANPWALMKKFGKEPVRYFLIRDGGVTYDAEFSERTVEMRYKKDLAGQLGNLAMRCCAPKINPSGKIPSDPGIITDAEENLVRKLDGVAGLMEAAFEEAKFSAGLEAIFDCISEANKYWDTAKPWTLVKSENPTDHARLQTVLYHAIETVRIASILLQPVLPLKMAQLLDDIDVPAEQRRWENAALGFRYSHAKWHAVSASLPLHRTPIFPVTKNEAAGSR
ncbi:tRNA synthetases class I (M)-domain-containing protein [Phlyctochytrium arcticum]|nr:tRNA synthetases class I (M)-domain-containing protein [Phlyctochytrium arcticum]